MSEEDDTLFSFECSSLVMFRFFCSVCRLLVKLLLWPDARDSFLKPDKKRWYWYALKPFLALEVNVSHGYSYKILTLE